MLITQRVLRKKLLRKQISAILFLCCMPCTALFATAYTNPGNASAPQQLNANDTFTNTAGVFQSTGTGVSSLGTVQVNSGSSGNTISITGGTITATGTSTSGATVPIYGATSSSVTISNSLGGNITNNSTQSSPVAISLTGPIVLSNSGTITGSITAGSSSSLSNASGGTITGAIVLGTGSGVSNSSTITGILTVGAGSTVTLNSNSATVSGGIVGNSSTLNFTNTTSGYASAPTATGIATLSVNSGTLDNAATPGYSVSSLLNVEPGATLGITTAITGAAATNNEGTLILRTVTNVLPTGALTNTGSAGQIQFLLDTTLPSVTTNSSTKASNSFLITNARTVTNNGTFTNSGTITSGGAATIQNNGTFNVQTGSTFANMTVNNAGILDLSAAMTSLAGFSNSSTGSIYLTGSGALPGFTIANGTSIYFGQNSAGTTTLGTFTISNPITTLSSGIQVFNGSTLTVSNTVGLGTGASFAVNSGATANIGSAISGAAAFTNNGTTTVTAGNVIASTGAFTNTGSFNVQSTWTPATYTSVTNTGTIYLTSAGTIATASASNLAWSGTLSLGKNSGGTDSNATFAPANNFSAPHINLYNASHMGGVGTITGNVYLTGTSFLDTTNVSGPSLTIGSDSLGAAFGSTLITLTNNFSGFNTINVNNGTLDTNTRVITNVNSALNVASGATLTIGANFTGSASGGGNNGTVNVSSAQFGLNTFTNNTGGVINFNAGTNNTTIINNNSSGSGGDSGLNIAGAVANNALITNNGTLKVTGTLSGSGSITNASGGTLTFSGGSTSNAIPITNASGGTFNISGNSTNTGLINNYSPVVGSTGGMTISAQLAGASTINNKSGGTLVLNGATLAAAAIVINNESGATLNVSGTTVDNSTTALSNAGTMNVTAAFSGTTPSITNTSTGELYFNGAANAVPVINNGTFYVDGNSSNTGAITNNNSMTISATLSETTPGTTSITNTNGSTLTLAAGADVSNTVVLQSGSTLDITGDVVMRANITNTAGSGAINIAGTLDLTGSATATLNSTGVGSSVTVSGQQNINSVNTTTYTNSKTHNTAIRSLTDYDSLTANQAIDLTGATVNITVDVDNTNGEVAEFTVLQGSAVLPAQPIVGGTINTTASDFYRIISYNTDYNTTGLLTISVNASQVTDPLDQEVAGVLQNMFNNVTNSGQQTLKDAFLSINRDLNESLNEMIPLTNSAQLDSRMQTTAFGKIDLRLAGLRNGWDRSIHGGINAGDISQQAAMWISATGSLTAQSENGEDAGYNAKSGLFLLGRDMVFCDDVIGIAAGFSLSHVKEFSNTDFISNIYRWHGLIYGSHNFAGNNYWDWLFSSSFNNNVGTREVIVSGNDFSTHADFNAYQLAVKLTRGKGFSFCDTYMFTPFTFLQYSYVHQNEYTETGSVAALNVEAVNQNVGTLGLGARFNLPLDGYKIIGMRELRAAVTYDFMNTAKNTTANFVVGSSSFTVTSSPVKLAVLLGAGIAFEFCDHFQLELDYDFEYRSHFTDNTGLVKLKYIF